MRRPCLLTGQIAATNGGSRDIDVYLVAREEFTNFRNGHSFSAQFASRRRTATTLDVGLKHENGYYLIVSNRFSMFTPKTVRFDEVIVTCG